MAIMVVTLATMIVLGFIQVVLRNFFDSGLPWAEIVIRNLVLWVGFAGAVVATAEGRHIAIGVLLNIIPQKMKRPAHFITSIFTSFVSAVLAYAAYKFILMEKTGGGVLVGNFPLWIAELIIPLTFVFISYQFLFSAFEKPKEDQVI